MTTKTLFFIVNKNICSRILVIRTIWIICNWLTPFMAVRIRNHLAYYTILSMNILYTHKNLNRKQTNDCWQLTFSNILCTKIWTTVKTNTLEFFKPQIPLEMWSVFYLLFVLQHYFCVHQLFASADSFILMILRNTHSILPHWILHNPLWRHEFYIHGSPN